MFVCDKFAPVRLSLNPEAIRPEDRAVLSCLIRAAAFLNPVYLRQVSHYNPQFKQEIEDTHSKKLIESFAIMGGPWNRFIGPATPVYEGMIVGENPKPDDIEVNVCKEKHLTAVRSTGADEKLTLITPVQLSLEEAIEFITDEELIEVTPKSIRLRKVILDTPARKRLQAQKRAALKEQGK